MKAKTVEDVVNRFMCTGCGTCSGVCPNNAIKMVIDIYGIYVPSIYLDACNNCRLCVKCCPGHEFNYPYFYELIHGKYPENPAIGAYIGCYSGCVPEKNLLEKVQSGGFVSAALRYGLEAGIFDGVVVTKYSDKSPTKPITYIARNEEEVLQAVGSKYNPVPTNSIIKELLNKQGVYAFVGTSCQIQGMRKAELLFPKLKDKVWLYIGLFCLKVFNYHYQHQIFHKIKITDRDIKYFRFRDKKWRGWPGDMRIVTANGKEYDLPGSFSRMWARSYFSNWRCQLCFDKLNEMADISCGDCRIPSQYGNESLNHIYYKTMGMSDIITRTFRGEDFVRALSNKGCINILYAKPEDIVKATGVKEKKLGLKYFIKVAKLLKLDFPVYNVEFIRLRKHALKDIILEPYSIFASAHYFLTHYLIRYKVYRSLLKILPHKLLWIISKVRERAVNYSRHKDDQITIRTQK